MMPHQTDRLSCKLQLSVFSTLIFNHAVVFLLLTHSAGGQSQVISQPQPIVAVVNDDITLPCHVKTDKDTINMMLEWSRPDLNPRFVHLRRSGKEHLVAQNPSYKGRTSVSINGLKQGDMSLKLSKVKLSDEGTYRSYIPELSTECNVQLVIDAVIDITKVSPGVLECKSKGWYPESEVFWLDGEENLLSAGPTETVRGPDDLYTVSRRLTVEKSDNYTCRVQQENINQIREAQILVADDFFMDSSGSSASTIIGLFVGIMFILAVVFVVWKWRQNKMNTKTYPKDEETSRGGARKSSSLRNNSEQKTLIEEETDRTHNTAESETMENQNQVEEENSECSNEKTQPCQMEEETQQEKPRIVEETNKTLPQTQSAEASTGSQFVMENGEQHKAQIGVQMTNDLDNREGETKSITGETQTPDTVETEQIELDQSPETNAQNNEAEVTESKEGEQAKQRKLEEANNPLSNDTIPQVMDTEHQMKTEKNVEENEKQTQIINNETATSGLTDGEGQQQQVRARGEAKVEENKAEIIKPTNSESACQSHTKGETQQNENKLDQTEGQTEGSLINKETPAEKDQSKNSGNKVENTANITLQSQVGTPIDQSPETNAQNNEAEVTESKEGELQAKTERKLEENNLVSNDTIL